MHLSHSVTQGGLHLHLNPHPHPTPHTTMSTPNQTQAGIRWRKRPSNAAFQGWVGIPSHPDGEPTPLFRYYVRAREDGSFDTWQEMDTIVAGWAEMTVTGERFSDPAKAQAACEADWLEIVQ